MATNVTLPADVNRIDETGHVWAFLDRRRVPEAVRPGAMVVAGDDDDPVIAEVVDIVEGPSGRQVVHLDVLGPAHAFAAALALADGPTRVGDRTPVATSPSPYQHE